MSSHGRKSVSRRMSVSLRIGTGYVVALGRIFIGCPVDNLCSSYEFPMDIQWINLCCLGKNMGYFNQSIATTTTVHANFNSRISSDTMQEKVKRKSVILKKTLTTLYS